MKHLISLSLKYVKRQKLRSFLTFCCIAISVFILGSVCAYSSSLFTTLKNNEIEESGSWEAHFTNIFNKRYKADPDMDDVERALEKSKWTDNALEVMESHSAVSAIHVSRYGTLYPHCIYDGTYIDEYGNETVRVSGIGFFEFKFDENEIFRTNEIYNLSSGGDDIFGKGDRMVSIIANYPKAANEIMLPKAIGEKYGYKVGDEITITIRPSVGSVSEDSAQVRQIKEKLKELNRTDEENSYSCLDLWTDEELGCTYDENKFHVCKNIYSILLDEFSLNGLEFDSIESGSEYTVKMKISGFVDERADLAAAENDIPIWTSLNSDFKMQEILAASPEFYKSTELENFDWTDCYIRVNERIELEDGIKQIIEDIGLDPGYCMDGVGYHTDLLKFELRGADVITALMRYIIAGIVILFIAWLIARFIIDNAFEISVNERSVQFASLRIIGASKPQISALVFTEALFYCLTAVPIGIAAAFLSCKSVLRSFRRLGFTYAEFHIMPLFGILSVLLCVIAIFISAYTSSMWASRKLSPSEAMNFGKPKSSKRRKHKKSGSSKIGRSSKGFILHYTFRNVFTKKSRFIISSIAMGLGVMFFTFSALGAVYFDNNVNKIMSTYRFDYSLRLNSIDDADEFLETFDNNESFSAMEVIAYERNIFASDEDVDKLSEFISKEVQCDDVLISAVSREKYDRLLRPFTSMTYDEFVESKGAVAAICPYDIAYNAVIFVDDVSDFDYAEDEPDYPRMRDDFYRTYSEMGYDEAPVISVLNWADEDKRQIKLIGAVCNEKAFYGNIYIPLDNAKEYFSERSYIEPICHLSVNGQKNAEKAYETIDKFAGEYDVLNLSNMYMLSTGKRELFNAIAKTILTFIISVWAAGVFSMMSTVNTSVLNRSRELKMVRAVGMTKRQLYWSVILESIVFSSVSTLLGMLSGTLLFRVLLNFVLVEKVKPMPLGLTAAVLVLTAAFNVIVAVISSLPALDNLKKSFK